jgi:hypothetical protein
MEHSGAGRPFARIHTSNANAGDVQPLVLPVLMRATSFVLAPFVIMARTVASPIRRLLHDLRDLSRTDSVTAGALVMGVDGVRPDRQAAGSELGSPTRQRHRPQQGRAISERHIAPRRAHIGTYARSECY